MKKIDNVHGWLYNKGGSGSGHAQPRKGGHARVQRTSCHYHQTYLYKEEYIMDQNTIIQLVSTLGFPIVCCGALFWRMIKSDEQHKAEMDKFSEALNNNTIVMTRLCEKMGDDGHV